MAKLDTESLLKILVRQSDVEEFSNAVAALSEMRAALYEIARAGGNLSDEAILKVGGVNEGQARAEAYHLSRKLAVRVLERYGLDTPQINE